MFPVMLAGLCVYAMDVATVVRDIDEALCYGYGGQAAVDLGRLSNNVTVCGIDTSQGPGAASVHGVLADGDVDTIVMEDGRPNDFTGAFTIKAAVEAMIFSSLVRTRLVVRWVTVTRPYFF